MEFVKEFAIFLRKSGAIKFGNFKLSSGRESPYYIDLRLVPSFPHQFRKMIKNLQNSISEKIGLDNFDCIASVPTSGLVIASALAIETVKPLVYIRQKPKDYGTETLIEGKIKERSRVLLVDDVGTTGMSLINAVKTLKNAGIIVTDAFVIVDRLEGAKELLASENVKLHQLADIISISDELHNAKLLDDKTFQYLKSNSMV